MFTQRSMKQSPKHTQTTGREYTTESGPIANSLLLLCVPYLSACEGVDDLLNITLHDARDVRP
jgi:hypothetical protein